jgi:hypothetical protein
MRKVILFIYGLFNNAASISDHVASSNGTISKLGIGKVLEGRGT